MAVPRTPWAVRFPDAFGGRPAAGPGAKNPRSISHRKCLARLVVHEPQRISVILNGLPSKPIELACLIAQWKFCYHIENYSFSDCARILGVKLTAFDELQISIQLTLQRPEVLTLILMPIEMIADYEKNIAIFMDKSKTINLIIIFDGHGAISLDVGFLTWLASTDSFPMGESRWHDFTPAALTKAFIEFRESLVARD